MIDWIWRVLLLCGGFFLFKEIDFLTLLGIEPTVSYSSQNGVLKPNVDEGHALLSALVSSAMIGLSGLPFLLKMVNPKQSKFENKPMSNSAPVVARDGKMEEKFFEIAAEEIKTKKTRAGLMAKALSEVEGDKTKAEALYLKLRVASLFDEHESGEAKINEVDTLSEPLDSNNGESSVVEVMAPLEPEQKLNRQQSDRTSAANAIGFCMLFALLFFVVTCSFDV